MLKEIAAVSQGLIILWSNRSTFAGDSRGDALSQLAEGLLVNQQIPLRLFQHVNKSGTDNQSLCIKYAFGSSVGRRASDEGDAVVFDADIGLYPRVSCAIHDVAITYENVILLAEHAQ